MNGGSSGETSAPVPGGLVFVDRPAGAASPSDVLRRLLAPWLEQRARAAIVSTELTTLRFLDDMAGLGLELEPHLLSGRIHFLPLYGHMSRRAPRREVLPRLRRLSAMRRRDVVVVDRFSAVLRDQWQGASPQAAWREAEETLRFFHTLAATGTTVLLTFEQLGLDPRVVSLFRHAAARSVRVPIGGAPALRSASESARRG